MTDRAQLLDDLRMRIEDGATPSRLIRHVLDVLGATISYSELCDVLQDAFQLPVVRISPSSLAPQHDHRGVVLNKTLLMEIVHRRGDWDAGRSQEHPMAQSWMDGLALRSPEEIRNEVRTAPVPGLNAKSWSALTSEEQDALHGHLTGTIVLAQRVEVLSRLVERLQEKICELEQNKLPLPSRGNRPVEKGD
jgi:hypothetical protein